MLAVARNVVTVILLIIAAVVPNRANAQEAPTSDECQAAVSSLAERSHDTLEWDLLPECGTMGAQALATALAGAGSESGSSYLRIVTHLARTVRAEPILGAAETLARDPGGTRASRVAGLLVLLGQYDAALYPPIDIAWEELTSVPLPKCKLLAMTGGDYAAEHPMPSGYVERIQAVAQDLSHDEDAAVQALARCMVWEIDP